ncbi:PHD-finger domain containing protein [Nitzschia inconspicua]|uniref:PHD-finger domain containing protein n=1 Tax=Nitzschia inconspicua TaxID=303405 RepID=A0A9K3LLN9_9STRA|nr:PHD-finger domain containing protein [Nitzschia inconspicua]
MAQLRRIRPQLLDMVEIFLTIRAFTLGLVAFSSKVEFLDTILVQLFCNVSNIALWGSLLAVGVHRIFESRFMRNMTCTDRSWPRCHMADCLRNCEKRLDFSCSCEVFRWSNISDDWSLYSLGGELTQSAERNSSTSTENASRKHFTRNQKLKSPEEQVREKEIQEKAEEEETSDLASMKPKLSLNGCANILATLDSRSYHRALIRDANRIAEYVLFPMSLPWTHKIAPVARNIPCDIDEMIDVITMDDGSFAPFENGSFGFGQFDTGQQRLGESAVLLANSSGMLRAAARRSTDPGVIEFSTVALPPPGADDSMTSAEPPTVANFSRSEDKLTGKEEILLRCFETMQARKRRKVLHTRGNIKNYKISVKINGSSSRTSIFEQELDMVADFKGLLSKGFLEATLPLEVEVGRKLKKAKAMQIAGAIGSYNVRQGPGLNDEDGRSSSRTNVGRTRLMWTKKDTFDQPQRASYSSLITGEQLEFGTQKRPREILLRVKINGEPFNGLDIDETENLEEDFSGCIIPFQATLHSDKLLRNLLVQCENRSTNEAGKSTIVPPRIKSVPDSCGAMHTVCVLPGRIALSSVSSLLNMHATADVQTSCTVCWSTTSPGSPVMKCCNCGLLVHPTCCLDRGQMKIPSEENLETTWECSVCSSHKQSGLIVKSAANDSLDLMALKKSKRKVKLPSRCDDSEALVDPIHGGKQNETFSVPERQCAVCRYSGGAMSLTKWGKRHEWVHEVCRIWTSECSPHNNKEILDDNECTLCGSAEHPNYSELDSADPSCNNTIPRCLVRCAAARCHVSVHPMCALVSSISVESKSKTLQDAQDGLRTDDGVKSDVSFCDQYTLTFASIKGTTDSFGKDPGIERTAMIPVVFCGIHNPKRQPSFYGLYPGGKYLTNPEKALTIPGCREPEKKD